MRAMYPGVGDIVLYNYHRPTPGTPIQTPAIVLAVQDDPPVVHLCILGTLIAHVEDVPYRAYMGDDSVSWEWPEAKMRSFALP